MDDAPIARAHRLEGDDLAVVHRLLAEAARHRGEGVLAALGVALGVDEDVPARQPRAVDDAIDEVLERGEGLPLLADDPTGIGALDLEADVALVVGLSRLGEVHGAAHPHLHEEIAEKIARLVDPAVLGERGLRA